MSEAISVKQLVSEAKSAYKRGDFEAAGRAYEAAAIGYQTEDDILAAAEMQNNSSVSFLQAGDVSAALQAVEGTAQVFADAGDIRRQGMALGNLGAALEADGRLEDAMDIYSQSADLLKHAGEDEFRANVMQSLSNLQLRTGRQYEALFTMEAGLSGIQHPKPSQRILKRLLRFPYKFLGK